MYNMVNLGQLMSSSLELLVEERYNRVSQCLLHVLKDDCHIYYFLSLVRVRGYIFMGIFLCRIYNSPADHPYLEVSFYSPYC